MIDLPKLSRRQFMAALLAGGVVTAEGLWMPGTKLISIPKPAVDLAVGSDMVRIRLIGGGGFLDVGVNGEIRHIPYGEPHWVPLSHFEALQNAKARAIDELGQWKEHDAHPFELLERS